MQISRIVQAWLLALMSITALCKTLRVPLIDGSSKTVLAAVICPIVIVLVNGAAKTAKILSLVEAMAIVLATLSRVLTGGSVNLELLPPSVRPAKTVILILAWADAIGLLAVMVYMLAAAAFVGVPKTTPVAVRNDKPILPISGKSA